MINHELTQHETSRRDLLAGIGMLGGLAALAACGKKATASRPPEIRPTTPDPAQTPETTPTAQSTWTSTSEPTPTQNGVISRLEQNPNYILDKTKFEDWDNKTLKQKRAVAREWFALNGFTEPIPKYNTGDNSHNDVDELVDWYNRMRYRPVWNLYRQDPAIARHIAEDIIANDSGINNRIATSLAEQKPLDERYKVIASTDIKNYKEKATGAHALGFVAIASNVELIDSELQDDIMLSFTIIRDSEGNEDLIADRSGAYNKWQNDGSGLSYYRLDDTK